MYSEQILQEGIVFLGISDPVEIDSIRISNAINLRFLAEIEALKQWGNRFKVPTGLTKKEYTVLLSKAQEHIDRYKKYIQQDPYNYIYIEEQQNWIEKKNKLKIYLTSTNNKKIDIPKAKQFPIDQLLEFNSMGNAICRWHSEKTPSLHLDKKRNKAHCFGCGVDVDSIDVYMKIHTVSLPEAVKRLI